MNANQRNRLGYNTKVQPEQPKEWKSLQVKWAGVLNK